SKQQNRAPRAEGLRPIVSSQATPEYALPAGIDRERGQQEWQDTLQKLSQRVDPHSFDNWFKPLKLAGTVGDVLFVKVPTPDFLYVREKYGSLLSEVTDRKLKLEFIAPAVVAS